jgi:hypothetical protein
MTYYINNLQNLEQNTIKAAILECPALETSLRFGRDVLRNKTSDELIELFASIPEHITDLNLSSNDLVNVDGLERAIAAIPSTVKAIDLSSNGLARREQRERVTRAITALPRTISDVDLSQNGLGQLSTSQARDFFQHLPETIKSLHLKLDNLGQKKAHLAPFLKTLPAHLSAVDLSANGLGAMNADHFIEALKALPQGVKLLDLRGHYPLGFSARDLIKIIKNIPVHITALDISGDHLLQTYSAADISNIIQAIPEHIKSIELKGNGLGGKPTQLLIDIFSQFPDTLRSVNLSGNSFHTKSTEDLNSIHNAFPKYVHLNAILDSYLEKRENIRDYNGQTKQYFCFNFFSCVHKSFSFTEKKNAILALKSVINGEHVDLTDHLPALKNGTLGKALQRFIQSTHAEEIVYYRPTTMSITAFVAALPAAVARDNQSDASLVSILSGGDASAKERIATDRAASTARRRQSSRALISAGRESSIPPKTSPPQII